VLLVRCVLRAVRRARVQPGQSRFRRAIDQRRHSTTVLKQCLPIAVSANTFTISVAINSAGGRTVA